MSRISCMSCLKLFLSKSIGHTGEDYSALFPHRVLFTDRYCQFKCMCIWMKIFLRTNHSTKARRDYPSDWRGDCFCWGRRQGPDQEGQQSALRGPSLPCCKEGDNSLGTISCSSLIGSIQTEQSRLLCILFIICRQYVLYVQYNIHIKLVKTFWTYSILHIKINCFIVLILV